MTTFVEAAIAAVAQMAVVLAVEVALNELVRGPTRAFLREQRDSSQVCQRMHTYHPEGHLFMTDDLRLIPESPASPISPLLTLIA